MTSKFALVIANTEYQDASFAKLTAPGKDAEEFAQVLRDLAAFDDVNVLLNEGEGKTRRSIARFFADRKHDDLLLLYFSGHGVRNEQGQLFLAANDTEISILEASGIPSDFVTQSMNNSRSHRQLLILDCCNSGAFAHGSKSATGVGKSMGIATAFEGSGFGRVVLTATDATQYAWEGDKVIGDTQKSVFTHFLIEGLKGDADRNNDGRVDVDELYDYAYEQVVRRTPKQTPGKWSYKQQGDLILRENLKPRDVKPAPLPDELLELLSHPNSGVRRAGIQDLISLVEGKHVGLVRAAQEKLREIAENDDSLSLRKTASDTLSAHGIMSEPVIEAAKENISAVNPVPVEIPKKQHKDDKKTEKPVRTVSPLKRKNDVTERTPRTLQNWKMIASKSNLRALGGIAGGLLIVSLLIWGGTKLLLDLPALSEPTNTLQTNVTFTSQPASTLTSEPEQTDTPLPLFVLSTPTSAFGIGSTMTGKDGMTLLYVPAGEFTMGSDNGNSDEKPVHTVYLDAFWIDETEVTNAMYSKCVQAGKCNKPSNRFRYNLPEYANHPVVYVSWNDAKAYCSWADRRLPTEAEWEKAASWDAKDQTKYVYPWGNSAPNESETPIWNLLNRSSYRVGGGDTMSANQFPAGASPYGALNMAANVWEWVSSLYKSYPYDATDGRENLESSEERVLRGGSWDSDDSSVRSASRSKRGPLVSWEDIGFRCAMSATPKK